MAEEEAEDAGPEAVGEELVVLLRALGRELVRGGQPSASRWRKSMALRTLAIRGSVRYVAGSGEGAGSIASQVNKVRPAGSSDIARCKKVVPLRADP